MTLHSNKLCFALALCFALGACEGGKSKPGQTANPPRSCPENQHLENNRCVENVLTLTVVNQTACYQPANGTTRLILQYVARDDSGLAVAPVLPGSGETGAYNTSLRVNNQPIDVESLLASDSELLKSDLAMSLVLDSSYSMLQHSPPAFTPMKEAAVDVLLETEAEWRGTSSDFHWDLAWFDSKIFHPIKNNADEPWEIEDLNAIPAPEAGGFTALYKAVDYMVNKHQQWYEQGIASDDNDRHVMIVFSDGKDNHSWFNDTEENVEGTLDNMLFWEELALPPVPSVADISSLEAVPNLRIHVLGMGSAVDEEELQAIAKMGKGQFFFVSDSRSLEDLFAQVQRELVTQQTLGVETPLPAGDYEFELRTTRIDDGAAASYTWTQAAGDTLPVCD